MAVSTILSWPGPFPPLSLALTLLLTFSVHDHHRRPVSVIKWFGTVTEWLHSHRVVVVHQTSSVYSNRLGILTHHDIGLCTAYLGRNQGAISHMQGEEENPKQALHGVESSTPCAI